MKLTQTLELYPDTRVTQVLFKSVKNAAELRQKAVEGKINGALINPTMVSHFYIIVAFYSVNILNLCYLKKMSTASSLFILMALVVSGM